jgi:hypothetical protein
MYRDQIDVLSAVRTDSATQDHPPQPEISANVEASNGLESSVFEDKDH